MDEVKRPSKTKYYLDIAKDISKRSTCNRRHYGAVIVNNDEIVGTGYNGSPRGYINCCDTGICHREGMPHNDGNYGSCPAVHAEMNAIISAGRKNCIGGTLYLYGEEADGTTVTANPCPICSGLISNCNLLVIGSKGESK